MRVLIIFNHPAPYKVKAFNELAKFVDLTVLFERTKAKDRPNSFYDTNDYKVGGTSTAYTVPTKALTDAVAKVSGSSSK